MAKLCAAGVTLRDQVNKKWVSRDKASDGWIGDAAHASRDGWGTNGKGSYHNPDPMGVVHAIDLDEDFLGKGKGEGVAKEFAEQLATYCREGKDEGRIAHIVYEDRVASGTANNWHFRGSGYDHFHHIHISFTDKANHNGEKFDLPIFKSNPTPPVPTNKIPPYPGRIKLQYKATNQFNAAAIPLLRCSTAPAPIATRGNSKGKAWISLAGAPMPNKTIVHVKKTRIS